MRIYHNLSDLADKAIKSFHKETEGLNFLPDNRYNRSFFPTKGQYNWFEGQLLYCLIRYTRAKKVIEISTASGYSTLFMALALQKNKAGKIYTFENDIKALKAAETNFRRYRVQKYIKIYPGDATINISKIKDIENFDIFFLDSLHTQEFAEWFIVSTVLKAKPEALFHMHDIMPIDARVRMFDGPPWGYFSIFRIRMYIYIYY